MRKFLLISMVFLVFLLQVASVTAQPTGLIFDLEPGMTKSEVRQHSSLPGWFGFYEDRGHELVFIQRNNFGTVVTAFYLVFANDGLTKVRQVALFPETNAEAAAFLDLRSSFDENPDFRLVSESHETDGETGRPANLRITSEGTVVLQLEGGPKDVFELVYEQRSRNRRITVDWAELESLIITYEPIVAGNAR